MAQPEIYDRLTPRGKRVLEAAAREAESFGHSYTGTEHLLLGLLDEPDGVAARVLNELGVDQAARSRVIEVMTTPPYRKP